MKSLSKFQKHTIGAAIATSLMLLIPLFAMQFTDEVIWTLSDFVIAGVLLFGTGTTFAFINSKPASNTYRFAAGIALIAGLFLVWANGAVGLIGSENEPFNMIYFGVLATGLIGAFIARFQPRGMAFTLFVMAFVQTLIAIFALSSGMHHRTDSSVIEILAVNAFFVVPFIFSALLFRHAAYAEANAR